MPRHPRISALLIACAFCWAADRAPGDQQLAAEVLAIFEKTCAECHGPDLARPDGDFGYVLDLPRVAANPEMIVPGNPETSELYQLIEHDEMPGPDATFPQLTPDEKETVRRWILAGAPAPAAESAQPATPQASPAPLAFGPRLVRAAGQFHPPSAHFPIALLIAALPAELMWQRTRKATWKASVRFCVMFGAASAVATAALGWCDAAFSSYTAASAGLLAWHRWLGTATAIWATATAALSEIAHREGQPRHLRYAFRATLLGGILLVSAAGYYGASLTFGPNHFRW